MTPASPWHFDLVSHWRLRARPEDVWAVLTQPECWPQWWPQVQAAQDLGEQRRRMVWQAPLGYRLVVELEVTESLAPQRLRAQSRGDLQGEGIWLLREHAPYTDVTYLWRVQLPAGWMRALAPVLAPLYRWSHDRVMRAGGEGLARYLGQSAENK
jgi:hypothetical protein